MSNRGAWNQSYYEWSFKQLDQSPFVKMKYDESNLEISHKTKIKGHFHVYVDLLLKTLYQTGFYQNVLMWGDFKTERQQAHTSVSPEY